MREQVDRQAKTCVSGQTCAVDGLFTETSAGDALQFLSDENSVAILDTCGADQPVPGFPMSGTAEYVSATGAILQWGDVRITATSGQYHLCWCGSPGARCDMPQHFTVDMGKMEVYGPKVGQSFTCVSGQACSLHTPRTTRSLASLPALPTPRLRVLR